MMNWLAGYTGKHLDNLDFEQRVAVSHLTTKAMEKVVGYAANEAANSRENLRLVIYNNVYTSLWEQGVVENLDVSAFCDDLVTILMALNPLQRANRCALCRKTGRVREINGFLLHDECEPQFFELREKCQQ